MYTVINIPHRERNGVNTPFLSVQGDTLLLYCKHDTDGTLYAIEMKLTWLERDSILVNYKPAYSKKSTNT